MTATPRTVPDRYAARLSASGGVTVIVAIVVAILAVRVFVAAHRPLSWAAAAVVAAVVLDPVADVLAERIRRVPAVLVCFLAVGGAVLGVAFLAFADLDSAVSRLQETAPAAATRIEDRHDRIGQLARDIDLTARLDDAVDGLRERVGSGGDVIKSTALTAPAYLVGAILTVFLMSYGPRIGEAAIDQLPEGRRRRVAEALTSATDRARTAGLLILADAVVVGALAGAGAWTLDLPAPVALGLVAGCFALLPHVGIVLGAVPVLLLTLGLNSTSEAALVLVVAAALQVVDSVYVRPLIHKWVRVGLLLPVLVVLLGYAVYGVGAAAYGLAYGIFVLAVLDEIAADDPDEATE